MREQVDDQKLRHEQLQAKRQALKLRKPEEWRQHPRHKNVKVSNWGNVSYYNSEEQRVPKNARHYERHASDDCHGYSTVKVNGKRESVHRLVAETFIGPCPKGYVCDHINRDRHNNYVENLKWISKAENAKNRSRTFSLEIARLIRYRYNLAQDKSGEIKKLSLEYKVDLNTIKDIVYKKTYKEAGNPIPGHDQRTGKRIATIYPLI